jgi:predicted DNA-binding protein YlxM (UPF0122 family)
MNDIHPKNMKDYPQIDVDDKGGWDLFTPEVLWYVGDFFKYELNGYEKLIFYSYYVNGMTLVEIAEAADCSFQNIGATIKKIEKKLAHCWKHKEKWKTKIDECKRDDKRRSGRDKKGNQ